MDRGRGEGDKGRGGKKEVKAILHFIPLSIHNAHSGNALSGKLPQTTHSKHTLRTHTHTHMHTHTCTHTHTHTHHILIHTHTHTHTQARTHECLSLGRHIPVFSW